MPSVGPYQPGLVGEVSLSWWQWCSGSISARYAEDAGSIPVCHPTHITHCGHFKTEYFSVAYRAGGPEAKKAPALFLCQVFGAPLRYTGFPPITVISTFVSRIRSGAMDMMS